MTQERAEALWAGRSKLFFKPSAGYGSKAAYRGDKFTRRAWNDVLAGDYVGQELVPPSARTVQVDGRSESLKLDIRKCAYDGAVLLAAARIYQDQTTNFRTPGGGFAPVLYEVAAPAAHNVVEACGPMGCSADG